MHEKLGREDAARRAAIEAAIKEKFQNYAFRVVDPQKRLIEITRPGQTFTYRSGDTLRVGTKEYEVDDILRGARSR